MSATLQQRATGILTQPAAEWPVIAAEPDTVQGIFTRYAMPLAAIGPVVLLLRFAGTGSLVVAIVQYVVQLAGLMVCAVVIEWLAPRFKSSGDTVQALKLVAYSSTATWLASVFNLIPGIGTLVMLVAGIYGVYLYYLGLPAVLRTPEDQRVPFMLVSAILIVVVFTVFSALVGILIGRSLGLML